MISISNLSLSFPHKTCFASFSTEIFWGEKIAIIGRNGSGKSNLLGMIKSLIQDDFQIGYVPQIVDDFDNLSGSQKLNKCLSIALQSKPDILLLDEPTNHLDKNNRRSLMKMLKSFHGILIIVSHDVELLSNCIDKFWHIDNGKIHIFSGSFSGYINETKARKAFIEHEICMLKNKKKNTHKALMKEQIRASKSREKGGKNIAAKKWPAIVSASKARKAEETSGKKRAGIANAKANLLEKLQDISLPEEITPKFSLSAKNIGTETIVSIINGSAGYEEPILSYILSGISFSITGPKRVAIMGANGSGKSTFLRAIIGDSKVIKTGSWNVPKTENIGYLDQNYKNLDINQTVLQSIISAQPNLPPLDARKHLNDFLFRKNEEVNEFVANLSGGEKARLSLARIAANTPKLLILDEITNNLDLETRNHMIEVLRAYPGAMIIVSHDQDFLNEIGIDEMLSLDTLI